MLKVLFLLAICGVYGNHLNSAERRLPLEPAGSELQMQFVNHHAQPSDINEHLPQLRRLARECSSVVEIGLRDLVSTWGILQGLAENVNDARSYLGIDICTPPLSKLRLAERLAKEQGMHFNFWEIDDKYAMIPRSEMLFIDTLHTYCHLTYELERFSPQVTKYIVMHDTSAPWGMQDDTAYHGNYSEYPLHINRSKKGLWPAVEDFLHAHPDWKLFQRYFNNHGLTVLRRDQKTDEDSDIHKALKNRMILCTGPGWKNGELLQKNTEADLKLIPFKKIFISANNPDILQIKWENVKSDCHLMPARGHQLDCLNCIIMTIQQAVNDPECADEDIIIFKHETVFANDMHLIQQAVKKIVEDGCDMVIRYWIPDRFYMTDVFFLKVGAARQIFSHLSEIKEFTAEYRFCEEFFTKYIANRLPKVFKIDYAHLTRKDTELGFFHMPIPGEEHWQGYWDKKNYETMFGD